MSINSTIFKEPEIEIESNVKSVINVSQDPLINPLMSFRLVYLRIIAKAWVDKDFRLFFTKPDNQNNCPDLLNPKNYSLLQSQTGKDYGLIKSMVEKLNLGHIEIQMIDSDEEPTKWENGWIGSDDLFIIYLPNKPIPDDVEAFAAYYQIFPTLFGTANDVGTINKFRIADDFGIADDFKVADDFGTADGFKIADDFGATDEKIPIYHGFTGPLPLDLGVGPEPFLEFGGVTLRAIALAWSNKQFSVELTDSSLDDASLVLSRWFGYTNPWNFKMQFRFNGGFTWDSKKKVWNNPPKNIVKLHFPRKPNVESVMNVALATYNESGPQYPFSCI